MQQTLAFAPTSEDLDEFYFAAPVLTSVPAPPEKGGQNRPEEEREG